MMRLLVVMLAACSAALAIAVYEGYELQWVKTRATTNARLIVP